MANSWSSRIRNPKHASRAPTIPSSTNNELVNLTDAVTADEAIAPLKSGMRVFVHGAAATPTPLLEAMVRNASSRDITLYHLHTTGPAPFVDAARPASSRP